MSIENISMTVNGVEVSLKNVTPTQLSTIVEALSKSGLQSKPAIGITESIPAKNAKQRKRKNTGAILANYQIEKTPLRLRDYFKTGLNDVVVRAKSNDVLRVSIDTGKLLDIDSVQVSMRFSIIFYFFRQDNESKNTAAIYQGLFGEDRAENPSYSAVSNYVSQCARLGILAKTTSGKGAYYHLSAWFLEQLESN